MGQCRGTAGTRRTSLRWRPRRTDAGDHTGECAHGDGPGGIPGTCPNPEEFDDDAVRFFELVQEYEKAVPQQPTTESDAQGVAAKGKSKKSKGKKSKSKGKYDEEAGEAAAAATHAAEGKRRIRAQLLRRQIVEQFILPDGFYSVSLQAGTRLQIVREFDRLNASEEKAGENVQVSGGAHIFNTARQEVLDQLQQRFSLTSRRALT